MTDILYRAILLCTALVLNPLAAAIDPAAPPKLEYRVRHILVATEPFAQRLLDKLKNGAAFGDLARADSMDIGSNNAGGDLGWVGPEWMNKPFSDAMIKLRKGETTKVPIRTAFGLHIIRVDDIRETRSIAGGVAAKAGLITPRHAGTVDATSTLTADERSALERKLTMFEERSGPEIVILLVSSTRGMSIEDYGLAVANEWRLGRRDAKDGVLVTIAKDDQRLRIEVGRDLESKLPDELDKQVIDSVMTPHFSQSDFYGGIDAGVDLLLRALKTAPKQELRLSVKKTPDGSCVTENDPLYGMLVQFERFPTVEACENAELSDCATLAKDDQIEPRAALRAAAYNGCLTLATTLLNRGIDVDAADPGRSNATPLWKASPLDLALTEKRWALTKLLMSKGAHVRLLKTERDAIAQELMGLDYRGTVDREL